jgi:hypothetical protein
MTHKIILYQSPDGLWHWYILPLHAGFSPLLLADGNDKKIRKAIQAARKSAKNKDLDIAYIYMERGPFDE